MFNVGIAEDGKSRRKDEKDEFDAFAQARTASIDSSKNRYKIYSYLRMKLLGNKPVYLLNG